MYWFADLRSGAEEEIDDVFEATQLDEQMQM